MKNQNKTGKGKSEKKGAFAPLIVKLIGGWSLHLHIYTSNLYISTSNRL